MTGAIHYPPADRGQWFGNKYDRPKIRPNVLLLHTTEGVSWPDYGGGGSSPHLTYNPRTGQWRQHFPLDVAAMALVDAPGGVATNRLNCVQVEIICTDGWASTENPARDYTVDLRVEDLSDDNLRDIADLWKFLNREWDVPLSITPRGFPKWNARRPTMTADEWNNFRGLCGHMHVLENDHQDPGAINANRILDFARGGVAPVNGEVIGRIGEQWRAFGGDNSPVGRPVGAEVKTAKGAFTPFERGFILWSPATDAWMTYGELRRGYERLGCEGGALGYPKGNEFEGLKPGRVQDFEGGTLYWTPAHGVHAVWGLIKEEYKRNGYEGGRFGYPVGPERREGSGWAQDFEGGTIRAGVDAPVARAAVVPQSEYVRPVKDPERNPISAQWHIPGSWAAGHHTGVDIACEVGTPVYATIGGDVRMNRSWGPAYGTVVYINDDKDGSDWAYCHLSRRVVSDGQKVQTGQLIGYSGNTGNTTGPHLHLERRPRMGGYGSDRDPNLWP